MDKILSKSRGQVAMESVFILGAALMISIVFYFVGDQTLRVNNLQNSGLFPVALLVLSLAPVLVGIFTVFKPKL